MVAEKKSREGGEMDGAVVDAMASAHADYAAEWLHTHTGCEQQELDRQEEHI